MSEPRWEHFEHDADIGLRAVAPTREALFETMALALTAVITDPRDIRPEKSASVACEAPDDGLLLVDWLNAVIYEMATRRMLFGEFHVVLQDHRLEGTLHGESVDRARHRPVVEVKGTTYTSLEFERREGDGWQAQCIVDV